MLSNFPQSVPETPNPNDPHISKTHPKNGQKIANARIARAIFFENSYKEVTDIWIHMIPQFITSFVLKRLSAMLIYVLHKGYQFDLIVNDHGDVDEYDKLEKRIRDSSDTDENVFIGIHRSVINSAIGMKCYVAVRGGVKTRNMRLTALYASIHNSDKKCLLLQQVVQQIDQLLMNNCNHDGCHNVDVKQEEKEKEQQGEDEQKRKQVAQKRKAIYNAFHECVAFDYNAFVKQKSKEIKQIEWKKNVNRSLVGATMEDVEGQYENEKLLVKIVHLNLFTKRKNYNRSSDKQPRKIH